MRNNITVGYAWDAYSVALTQRTIGGDYYLSSDAETDAQGNPTGGIVKDGDIQDDYSALIFRLELTQVIMVLLHMECLMLRTMILYQDVIIIMKPT